MILLPVNLRQEILSYLDNGSLYMYKLVNKECHNDSKEDWFAKMVTNNKIYLGILKYAMSALPWDEFINLIKYWGATGCKLMMYEMTDFIINNNIKILFKYVRDARNMGEIIEVGSLSYIKYKLETYKRTENVLDAKVHYFRLFTDLIAVAGKRKDADILKYLYLYITNMPSDYVKYHDGGCDLVSEMCVQSYKYFCEEFIDWYDVMQSSCKCNKDNRRYGQRMLGLVKGLDTKGFDHFISIFRANYRTAFGLINSVVYYNLDNSECVRFIDYVSNSYVPMMMGIPCEAQDQFYDKIVNIIIKLRKPYLLEWMLCNTPSYMYKYESKIRKDISDKSMHVLMKYDNFDLRLKHNACYQKPEFIT